MELRSLPFADSPFPAETRTGVMNDAEMNKAINSKWVLVMDDDDIIRFIMRAMLEQVGYKVYVTENSDEAIKCYREAQSCGSPFDVAILDLHVWGSRCGKETLIKLREIDPDVKAIIMSGSTDDPAITDYRSYGFKGVLTKPFTSDELAGLVNLVVDERRVGV